MNGGLLDCRVLYALANTRNLKCVALLPFFLGKIAEAWCCAIISRCKMIAVSVCEDWLMQGCQSATFCMPAKAPAYLSIHQHEITDPAPSQTASQAAQASRRAGSQADWQAAGHPRTGLSLCTGWSKLDSPNWMVQVGWS